MADDLERLVRESLKTVDRSRRIAFAATWLLFFVILFTLGFLFARARARGDGQVTAKMLWVAVTGQMAFVGICIALVAGHVTRMTKAVLRAIELTRSRE